jgi:hypothetical protein
MNFIYHEKLIHNCFSLPSFKGATLGRGFNRMMATLSAGALGVGVHSLATMSGEIGQPIVIGFFVFMTGTTYVIVTQIRTVMLFRRFLLFSWMT